MDEAALKDLRTLLRRFAKKNGLSAKYGDWMLAEGGYDLNWQLYHKDTPVIDCVANFINGSGGTLKNIEMDRKDFLEVVKVIKEEYPDVLTKAEEKAEMTGLDYKTLWEELEDVPIDENENIDVDWRQFPKGTFREDIWHWFEEEYGISVGELMNGDDEGYAFSATKEGLEKVADNHSSDKGFRDMVRALDECVKEIASDTSTKMAREMTLEEALNKRDIDKFDFMELMQNAAKSPVIHVGTDRVAGLNWDKQQDRKNAEKVLKSWMKKPGKKIAKEIEAMRGKEASGR